MLKKNSRKTLRAVATGIEFLGGVAAVQEMFKLKTAWAVRKWLRQGIPPDRIVDFHAAITSRAAEQAVPAPVSLEELRPDLYRTAPPVEAAVRSDRRLRAGDPA